MAIPTSAQPLRRGSTSASKVTLPPIRWNGPFKIRLWLWSDMYDCCASFRRWQAADVSTDWPAHVVTGAQAQQPRPQPRVGGAQQGRTPHATPDLPGKGVGHSAIQESHHGIWYLIIHLWVQGYGGLVSIFNFYADMTCQYQFTGLGVIEAMLCQRPHGRASRGASTRAAWNKPECLKESPTLFLSAWPHSHKSQALFYFSHVLCWLSTTAS